MFCRRWLAVGIISTTVVWAAEAQIGDVKITLPKPSHMTPVQRLNQEGVEAVRKHNNEKAEALFYKAYLLDPDDPFTLNNLGYISELQGQVDRAQRFYALAGQQATDAVIDRSSSRRVEGRPLKEALAIPDRPLEINHDNVEAVRLLSQGRAPEADLFLQRVLEKDPNNVFTLNNMGVAKEMEGESQVALGYYDAAAAVRSDAAAAVTLDHSWRGKPLSEMAAQNARNLRSRLANHGSAEVDPAELSIRGVAAINRNDFGAAERNFRKAYALDPNNPFAINNIGYVAEIEGDPETAQFFYEKAHTIANANTTVALATRRSAEGLKLSQVASQSDAKVQAEVQQERNVRRSQHEPLLLRRRNDSVVEEPQVPPPSSSLPQQSPPPQ
jgi:Flp pilus assembly protein TadD